MHSNYILLMIHWPYFVLVLFLFVQGIRSHQENGLGLNWQIWKTVHNNSSGDSLTSSSNMYQLWEGCPHLPHPSSFKPNNLATIMSVSSSPSLGKDLRVWRRVRYPCCIKRSCSYSFSHHFWGCLTLILTLILVYQRTSSHLLGGSGYVALTYFLTSPRAIDRLVKSKTKRNKKYGF